MHKSMKKFLSLFVVICIAFTILPLSAFATGAQLPDEASSSAPADTAQGEPQALPRATSGQEEGGADLPAGEQGDTAGDGSVLPEQAGESPDPEVAFSRSTVVNGVEISLCAPAGVFPADAVLQAAAVETADTAQSIDDAVAQVRGAEKTVAESYAFDIKVLDALGGELQPDTTRGTVTVGFGLADRIDAVRQVDVYHVAPAPAAEEPAQGQPALVAQCMEQTVDGAEIAVETDSFSFYVVEFTVGKLQYVLQGDESAPLSTILDALQISGTVTAARVSDPSLFTAGQDDRGVWMVHALHPFESKETLWVTVNGVEYEIGVTDAAGKMIAFYDFDGWISNKVSNPGTTVSFVESGSSATRTFYGTGTGTDNTYLRWTGATVPGAGYKMTIGKNISTTYTMALRISFDDLGSAWRKIVDYSDFAADTGFYFKDGQLQYYPSAPQGATYSPGDIVDIIITRNGATDQFKVFTVSGSTVSLVISLTGSDIGKAYTDGTNTVFGFFQDDGGSEFTTGGCVYSIKLWDYCMTDAEAGIAADPLRITYNANGGSGAPVDNTAYTPGQAVTISSATPTRSGFTFYKWLGTDGKYYASQGTFTIYSATTFTAQWNAPVTFNANGGANAPGGQTKTPGVNLTLSTGVPTRANYTFAGWNTNANGTGTAYAPGAVYTANNTALYLYAQWNPNITYALGHINTSNASKTIYAGTTYSTRLSAIDGWALPDSITLAVNGSVVTGYTYNQTTGQLTVPGSLVTGPMTITAAATPIPITRSVYLNAAGGVLYADGWNGGAGSIYAKGITGEELLPTPTAPAYSESVVFAGWYASPTYSGSKVTRVDNATAAAVTYYAKWVYSRTSFTGTSMYYRYTGRSADVRGYDNGYVQTTYGNGGFQTYYKTGALPAGNDRTSYGGTALSFPTATGVDIFQNISGTSLYVAQVMAVEGNYVTINYIVQNRGTTAYSGVFSIGAAADVQIRYNDSANITRGGSTYLSMSEGTSATSKTFRLYVEGPSYGVTDVDRYWIGGYSGSRNFNSSSYTGNVFNDTSAKTGDKPYDARFTSGDSALAYSWSLTGIPAGESVLKTVKLGVGALSDFCRYTATLNAGGGVFANGSSRLSLSGDTITVNADGSISANGVTTAAPARTGFAFEGWFDGSSPVTGTITADQNLTARWAATTKNLINASQVQSGSAPDIVSVPAATASIALQYAGGSVSQGATAVGAVSAWADYSCDITITNGYLLPESIAVSAGGVALTKGTGYTYTLFDAQKQATLVIPAASITGDITVCAVGHPAPAELPTDFTVSLTPATGAVPYETGATLRAVCTPATLANHTYKYQWYESPDGKNQGGTAITGATGSTFTTPAASPVGAHSYYCIVTCQRNNGQEAQAVSDAVNVTVNMKTANLGAVSLSPPAWEFGQAAGTPSVTGTVPAGATVAYTYYTDAACTIHTETENGAAQNGGLPAIPGTYYVKASVDETANTLAGETAAASFTISPTTGPAISVSGFSGTYDALPHTVSVTGTGAGDAVYYSTDSGTDKAWSLTAPQFTSAGALRTVYVKVTNPLYADRLENAGITIDPCPVLLEWAGGAFTFDNTEKSVAATIVNLYPGDTCALTYADHAKTNAGNYTARVTGLSNTNYTLAGGSQTSYDWAIARTEPALVVDAGDIVVVSGGLSASFGCTYTGDGPLTATSSDESIATVSGPDGSGQFTITPVGAGTVTITVNAEAGANYSGKSAGVDITVLDGRLIIASGYHAVYDGGAHCITVDVSGIAGASLRFSTDGATYSTLNPAFTQAGTDQTVYYRVMIGSEVKAAGSAVVTITPRPVNLAWTGGGYVYDNTPKAVAAHLTNLCAGDSCALTLTQNEKTDAGSFTATVAALANPNYTLDGGANTMYAWTIAQAVPRLLVGASDITVVSGGANASLGYTYGGDGTVTAASSDPGIVTVAGPDSDGKFTITPVGEGMATITVHAAAGPNFSAADATVGITAYDGAIIVANGYSAPYDGNPHTIAVDASGIAGASVQFSTDNSTFGADCPEYTHAGPAKTVYYRVMVAGTAVASGSAEVAITPRALEKPTVTGALTYDGAGQTVALSGFDAATMTVTGNTGTDAANYTAVVRLNDTTDSMWADGGTGDVSLGWAIGARPLRITANPQTVEYCDPQTISDTTADATAVGLVAGHTLDRLAFVINGNFVVPGSAAVADGNAVDVTANYAIQYGSGALTVVPAKLAVAADTRWDTAMQGKALWSPVPNASGYRVQLYVNGAAVGAPQILSGDTAYDFTGAIVATGTGSYTFTVTALGDGIFYADSDTSPHNGAYGYISPRFGIVLQAPALHIFPAAKAGYDGQTPLTVLVLNGGNQPTGPLTVTVSGAGAFVLSKTTVNSLGINDTGSFTVAPAPGLAAGEYTATVMVSGTKGIIENFVVRFTVTAAAAPVLIPTDRIDDPEITGDGGDGGARQAFDYGKGQIVVTVPAHDGETMATLPEAQALIQAVLSPEELTGVEQGDTIEIKLDVRLMGEGVPEADRALIQTAVEKFDETVPDLTLGEYIDITLSKRAGGEWTLIPDAGQQVEIVIAIPREMQRDGVEYYVIRAHDGGYTLLEDKDSDPETVTILTRYFSTYALAYQAKGASALCFWHWIVLAVALAYAMFALLWKERDRTKRLLSILIGALAMLAFAFMGLINCGCFIGIFITIGGVALAFVVNVKTLMAREEA